ncbi:hypothetical protein TWF694_003893 [Orbilia ellipsospora]|uniref:CENP-C homolog n=1 Tax=Orbilia ellipsospora TaxID=2528407 RepID=A0AAV9WXG1_9PEZI
MAYAAGKKRENMHTDIGMVGRKTGFSVKNLPRNDDGMENMSAFFSSPQAPPEAPPTNTIVEDSFLSDDSENEVESVVDARKSSDLPSLPIGKAIITDFPDGSISMDIEESSARSIVETLESRRNGPRIRQSFQSPAKRRPVASAKPSPHGSKISLVQPSLPPSSSRPQRRSTGQAVTPPKHHNIGHVTQDAISRKENLPKSLKSMKPTPVTIRGNTLVSPTSTRPASRDSARLLTQSMNQTRAFSALEREDETLNESDIDIAPALNAELEKNMRETSRPVAENQLRNLSTPSRQTQKAPKKSANPVSENTNHLVESSITIESRAANKGGRRKPPSHNDIPIDPKAGLSLPLKKMLVEAEPLDNEDGNNVDIGPEPVSRSNELRNAKSKRTVSSEPLRGTASDAGYDLSEKKRAGRPRKTGSLRHAKDSPFERGTLIEKPPDNSPLPLEPTIAIQGEVYEEAQPTTGTNVPAKRGRKRKMESLISDMQNPSISAGSLPKSRDNGILAAEDHSEVFGLGRSAGEQEPNKAVSDISKVDRPRRSRIAPLQFWKNERRVYKVNERHESGTAVSLSEQVIRVEDTPVTKPKKRLRSQPTTTKNSGLAKRKTREKSDTSSSYSEADDEDWESTGKLVGMVKQWSSKPSNSEVGEIEDEIATSRHGIEFKPIFGSDYLFAKTLGKEFMGCGILELQRGASKKLKSSGKMQLVFFMLEGKVEAEVNELGFRIGKGGQFQVPRGNMYKITNPFATTARIFFAQACIPEVEED